MDPIERDLLQRTLKVTEDTNRVVHKLRRGMWWGRLTTVVFWLLITVGPFVAYYYYFPTYIQPYTQKLEQMYTQYQQGNQQVQSYQSQLSNFFGNLMPSSTPTTTKQQ